MQRTKPLVQHYASYTQEDFAVWRLLFNRQMAILTDNACSLYLETLGQIGFNADEIPDFTKVNTQLKQLTGWQLTAVPEIVPQKEFFELLAQKIFPATCWLRTLDELDYIEEPDMFHDVFGHVPLLADPVFASYMQAFGELALKRINDPEAIELLGKVYWFTIEFGLLQEASKSKVFGAGIISSKEEVQHAIDSGTPKRVFNVHDILHTNYRTDILQEQYFVIDSFQQLEDSMPQINELIRQIIVKDKRYVLPL